MAAADKPMVFGAPYSVYVRAVRLALEEKGIAYELVPIDIFASDGPPPEHLMRHPFGKIPAFEHAGFRLYEAEAITRYIDEAFDGPPATTRRSSQPRADDPDHQYSRQLRLSHAGVGHVRRTDRPPGDRSSHRRSESGRRIVESGDLFIRSVGVNG